jgi:hypothetical protein
MLQRLIRAPFDPRIPGGHPRLFPQSRGHFPGSSRAAAAGRRAQTKRPRPSLNRLDRFFWTTLRRKWSRWSEVLVIVKPETVVAWHRAGFRLYWRWRSRSRGGRPKVSEEIRTLIRRMAAENADWGAPKIHGELLKVGFEISERTVARYLQRLREAFPEAGLYRYAILDHDSKFDADVIAFLKATGLRPKRTSVQAPWQNGTAERWVGSCRREILDHIIAFERTTSPAAHSRLRELPSQ